MTTERYSRECLLKALMTHFGFSNFRDCQEEAVRLVLEGKNVFVNMATGGGKSLCYQLPAAIGDGLVVVISPLIALMHDQVAALRRRKIAAAYVDSTLEDAERKSIYSGIQNGDFRLLYISPEQLNTQSLLEVLRVKGVWRLVVDEAHCVSTWGHDFRPDYLRITEAAAKLKHPPFAAFTATAPVLVRDDVLKMLKIPEAEIVIGEMDRPNLVLRIRRCESTSERNEWLTPILARHADAGEKTIVYFRRIREIEHFVKQISPALRAASAVYHGELEPEERGRVEVLFREGKLPVLFATKAFGMGVDVSDIRFVYHYGICESLEEYWQEAGRAGRDGEAAVCTLLYTDRDLAQVRSFIMSANPPLGFIEGVWTNLGRFLKGAGWYAKVPERFFYAKKFLAGYSQGNSFRASMAQAAIAQLIEHRMIRIEGNKLYFLIKPDQIKRNGFPISEGELQVKLSSAYYRLGAMIRYARDESRNPRAVILDHLLHNTVARGSEEFDDRKSYKVPEEVETVVLRSVARRDWTKLTLINYLQGNVKGRGIDHGRLAKLSRAELLLDVEQLQNDGLIRPIAGPRLLLSISDKGLELLRARGIKIVPAKTYRQLRRRLHSPLEKQTLIRALREWWSIAQFNQSPNEWWEAIREFIGERFRILDEEVQGIELVAQFFAKPVEPRGRRKAVTLTDAKLFLSYLYGTDKIC